MATNKHMTPGERAFTAYTAARFNVDESRALTHDGKPIPLWGDLGDPIRTAWEAAATAGTPPASTVEPTMSSAEMQRQDVEMAINMALRSVRQNTQQSRERSMVITKLDEAYLWARETRMTTEDGKPHGADV